jgi:phosphomannomutase / phosphoglucomutase
MRFSAFGNKNSSQRGPAEKRGRSGAPSLSTYWLRALIGVALATLLAFAIGLFAWMEGQKSERLLRLKGFSAVVAGDIERRVASLQGRLRELGADPQLRQALLALSTDELRTMQDRLTHNLPGASQVRLLIPGACEGRISPTKSFSYAALDLVCQAERQRRVTSMEAHRPGSPDEHLAIAAPVLGADGKTLLGVIYVSVAPSLLPSLDGTNGEWGHMSFQQNVGSKAITLGSAHSGAPSDAPDHRVSIKGTRLGIASWVGASVLDKSVLLDAVVAYLVLMGLVTLAMWLPLRGMKRGLTSDYGALVELVEDAVSAKPLRPTQHRLAESQPIVEAVSGLLRRLRQTRGAVSASPEATYPTEVEREGTDGRPAADALSISAQEARNKTPLESTTARLPILPTEPVPAQIFRASDIRGIVDRDLTADLMYALGLAVGTEAEEAGDQIVIVGRDTRPSSRELSDTLVVGLRASGRDVLDLGVVPTPLIYFATRSRDKASGAMVTASHDAKNYNGLKVIVGGIELAGQGIAGLRERILADSFARGDGDYQVGDVVSDYLAQVEMDVAVARPLKVVIDCGNAAASVVAPRLYRALGCDLVELNCEPELGFPMDRIPDPSSPEYLEDLQQAVLSQEADIGLAFDGDGDRLGVVDSSGKIIWSDRVLMLLAPDVLSRHPGTDVIFDAWASSHLATEILRHGGRPVLWKSGQASLKAKLEETGALLAGDWNGHFLFAERWHGLDDALYAGARLLELLALDTRSSAEVFAALPGALATPEIFLPLAEGEAPTILRTAVEEAVRAAGYYVRTENGLRVESERAWGYVRASSTPPALIFRFEAEDRAGLAEIQDLFRDIMGKAARGRHLPF